MKYPESVYIKFDHFFAQCIEIAKDKVGLFNSLVSPPVRKQIQGKSFQNFLLTIVFIIKKAGWYVYVAIGGLIALGALAFYGGIGTILATNPLLAAAIVALGSGSIYLLWKHKDFVLSSKKVGERYKEDFDLIVNKFPTVEEREKNINILLRKCVKSLCIECFQANSDEFQANLEKEDI